MKSAEITEMYPVEEVYGMTIEWNGWRFLTIYGKHKAGWFIAFPHWRICIESDDPDNVMYNSQKLSTAFNNDEKGKVIAEMVKLHWHTPEYIGAEPPMKISPEWFARLIDAKSRSDVLISQLRAGKQLMIDDVYRILGYEEDADRIRNNSDKYEKILDERMVDEE